MLIKVKAVPVLRQQGNLWSAEPVTSLVLRLVLVTFRLKPNQQPHPSVYVLPMVWGHIGQTFTKMSHSHIELYV
jgi:hypothetical protein